MDLGHYFETTDGTGILATCDQKYQISQAVYSKPFVVDENTVAFVMKQRTSHRNLSDHLNASYLFIEKGDGYKGIRFRLTMIKEEKNRSLTSALRDKQPCIYPEGDDSDAFLVFFQVGTVRSLVGNGTPE